MSETPHAAPPHPPTAVRRRRRRISLIWFVPIIAGGIAAYLVAVNLANRGPLITLTFQTANGITAQQTEVRHKAVTLGMVESVRLTDDFKNALVHVRMNRQGGTILTDHARFWVVRPRLSTGNISGLETLVSGAYIEVDPGDAGGSSTKSFLGLEDPPGVRSDEPGRAFTLKAGRLGSIGPGAPLFYRDVNVGEVLSYDLGDGLGPVTIHIFVRAPFDRFVHAGTHFWNASGISVNLGARGVHVELESLQALLSGGVAFETPHSMRGDAVSPQDSVFQLYDDKSDADSAGYQDNIPFVTYFQSSVAGLGRGSPVQIFGIQVGTVRDVQLLVDEVGGHAKARVTFELQPERFLTPDEFNRHRDPAVVTQAMVGHGMRAVLESGNLITGQKDIALQFVPNAPSVSVEREGNALLMPSQPGGMDNIMSSLSDISTKLAAIPFDEIGKNLNSALASISHTVNGPDVRNALQKLSETLTDVQHLVRHADSGLTPMLQRLPQISKDLQQAVANANAMLGDGGYGGNSDFNRNIGRVLDQVNDAARSIRLLADFLERHPEALVRGRTGQAAER